MSESEDISPRKVKTSHREKSQGIKRLNPLGFPDDKIPPKSPRPRRNIWLSRSQSDIFSRKPGRKVNVQDPYYDPPPPHHQRTSSKINPFTAREDLMGGKIKFQDMPSTTVFSHMFDLHSPPGSSAFSGQPSSHQGPGGGPQHQEPPGSSYWQQLPGRECRSLPVSPQLPLSEVFHPVAAPAVCSNNNGCSTCTTAQLSTTLPGTNGQLGNDVRSAFLSGWAKKYVVIEIPPYRPREEDEDEEECDAGKGEVFDDSWSPMVPSSERDNGEAMDYSSGPEEDDEKDEEELKGQKAEDKCVVYDIAIRGDRERPRRPMPAQTPSPHAHGQDAEAQTPSPHAHGQDAEEDVERFLCPVQCQLQRGLFHPQGMNGSLGQEKGTTTPGCEDMEALGSGC